MLFARSSYRSKIGFASVGDVGTQEVYSIALNRSLNQKTRLSTQSFWSTGQHGD